MSHQRSVIRVFGALLAIMSYGSNALHAQFIEPPTFSGIGKLQGTSYSAGNAVSGDGRVVVGWSGTWSGEEYAKRAVRFADGELVQLVGPSGFHLAEAFGVSANGAVIVGVGIPTGGEREAFRWEDGVVTRLGDVQGGLPRSVARAVSADGRVVVGYGYGSPTHDRAFRWEDGVLVPLPDPFWWDHTRAYAVSANGRVIVGVGWASAVRWVDGVADELESPHAGSGTYQIIACAVSDDGRIIAGGGNTPSGQVLLRWVDGQVETLETGLGLNLSDPRCGISADGTTIVWGHTYIWRSGSGLSVLSDHLTQTLGLNLGGLYISKVNGVSLDSLTVVGSASGIPQGWVAFLGRTAPPTDTDGDGVVDSVDLCPFTIADVLVDPTGCPPFIPGDLDRDGDVDLDDFAIVQRCMTGAGEPGDPTCNTTP